MIKATTTYRHYIYKQGLETLLFTLVMLSSSVIFGQGYVNPNRNKTETATVRSKPFESKNFTNVKPVQTTSSNALVRSTATRNKESFRNGLSGSQSDKKQTELIIKNLSKNKRYEVIAAVSTSEIEKSLNKTTKSPILNDKKFQNRTIAYCRPFKTYIIYQKD